MHRSREWLYERIRRDERQDPEVSGRARVPEGRPRLVPGVIAGYSNVDVLSEWETFTGPRLYAALADRLTHEGSLIRTGTAPSRLKAAEYEYRSARRS